MVYSNKFVLAVLYKGKPQKELGNGVVQLPFNSEYTLRLRNRNNRRAVVKIYIDGENVSGDGYLVNANDFVDIKRHADKDRAFKFVDLDSPDAVDYGKNGSNDDKTKGTVEARFFFEKETTQEHHHHHHHHHHEYVPRPKPYYPRDFTNPKVTWTAENSQTFCNADGVRSADGDITQKCCFFDSPQALNEAKRKSIQPMRKRTAGAQSTRRSEARDGCTVEGKKTGQHFNYVQIDVEDTSTNLKIFLQGYDKPETVKKKKRKTNKEAKIEKLEDENENLRQKIAELENEKLKNQLEKLKSE